MKEDEAQPNPFTSSSSSSSFGTPGGTADEAVRALHHAGANSVIKSIPDSSDEAQIETCKASFLKRFQDLRYDNSS